MTAIKLSGKKLSISDRHLLKISTNRTILVIVFKKLLLKSLASGGKFTKYCTISRCNQLIVHIVKAIVCYIKVVTDAQRKGNIKPGECT